jgi:hypothetical protein
MSKPEAIATAHRLAGYWAPSATPSKAPSEAPTLPETPSA